MISALDNHLLRAYLDGEMDAAAADAFEVLLIERPELAELVDADTALRMALSAASEAAAPVVPSRADAAPGGMAAAANTRARSNRRRSRALTSLVAASVLVAGGIGIGRWLADHAPAAIGSATLVSVDRLRSTIAQTQQLRVPAQGSLVLSVPVADSGCDSQVQIRQAGATLEARAQPDAYGFANLVLDAARLPSGKADIVVLCGQNEAARYTVEITR